MPVLFDVLKSGDDEIQEIYINSKKEFKKVKFAPYFYAIGPVEKEIKTEDVEKKVGEKVQKIKKILCENSNQVVELSKHIEKKGGIAYEHDIPFVFRYLLDTKKYVFDGLEKDLKILAFDIEVYNVSGIPNPENDQIIVIGVKTKDLEKTFYWKKGEEEGEKRIIKEFLDFVAKEQPDIITGYASSVFDFPYLSERAKKLGIKFEFGSEEQKVNIKKRSIWTKLTIPNMIHLDVFDAVDFLTSIGAIRLPKNDLPSIYREFFKKEKFDIPCEKIGEYWEKEEHFEELLRYNQEDVRATYELCEEILPIYTELTKLLGFPMEEIIKMSASQLVEWLIIRKAIEQNILIPKRPTENLIKQRMLNPIKGAFVKSPEPGLHEKIVVCDFRSLYPSIIIAHNISPDTLNCEHEECFKVPEVNHKFCTKKKGLIPEVLEELIEKRIETKNLMKKYDRGTKEYKKLYFKQFALKILLNSFYGYLGFARSRWYSRECAESITALARHYIQKVIKEVSESGFKVIYADTDSCFFTLGNKPLEDAKKMVEKINKELPEKMELEFQGYYPRGLFVTKREGGAAKKKYALMREDGVLEIKGFELVRRDWANIAKKAQEVVIEKILKEGKVEDAIKTLREIIKEVQEGKAKKEDLIIMTQIQRKISKYEQQAPHVKAAKRLMEAGHKITPGMMLEYIVVKGLGSISDRSIPIQLLKNEKYDPEYYIQNQILPAVLKILEELGVKPEDIVPKKQQGLEKWMN
ncbi:MAG: DNA-directed DNA polymerase [archaeon]